MQKSTIIAVLVAAVLMFAAGWFAGRWALERDWGNPVHAVTAAEAQKAAVADADPSPAAGTKIVGPLPLKRMREAMKAFTEKDPVVMLLGSFARDDDDKDVHLVVKNRGDCKATRLAGVAYGYDAWGRPAQVNKGGKSYLAFDVKDAKVEPGATAQLSIKVKDPGTASLAVAQLDRVECDNGKVWTR
ncbi:MAG: hypothetical protein U0359_09080 [Byssovorax sp.]